MTSKVPRVLVTGASGYVATHIVKRLLEAGSKVRGTVRNLGASDKVSALKSLCPGSAHPLELMEVDLMKPDGWAEAVEGCEYVLHTASPFPNTAPKDDDELIRPAVDGTLSVLEACQKVGGVRRVVLTSSVAAVSGGQPAVTDQTHFTEDDWLDVNTTKIAYAKSKTLAEKAAWDFVKGLAPGRQFELSVLNPASIMGPVLCGGYATSMDIPKTLFERKIPFLPHFTVSIVDVRDVAEAHVVAMTLPEAAGQRFLLASHNMWAKEIADVYKEEFGPLGYNIPTWSAPYIVMKIAAMYDKKAAVAVSLWGKQKIYSKEKMTNVLGIKPRSSKETLIDMAYSMIDNGFLEKTPQYLKVHSKD